MKIVNIFFIDFLTKEEEEKAFRETIEYKFISTLSLVSYFL